MGLIVIFLQYFYPRLGFQKYIYFEVHTNKTNFYVCMHFIFASGK